MTGGEESKAVENGTDLLFLALKRVENANAGCGANNEGNSQEHLTGRSLGMLAAQTKVRISLYRSSSNALQRPRLKVLGDCTARSHSLAIDAVNSRSGDMPVEAPGMTSRPL